MVMVFKPYPEPRVICKIQVGETYHNPPSLLLFKVATRRPRES